MFAGSGLVLLCQNNMAAGQSHKSDEKEKLFHIFFKGWYGRDSGVVWVSISQRNLLVWLGGGKARGREFFEDMFLVKGIGVRSGWSFSVVIGGDGGD